MSIREPIKVVGTVLSESASGTKILTISTKTVEIELEFSPEQWRKLEESAGWHRRDLSPYTNGVAHK